MEHRLEEALRAHRSVLDEAAALDCRAVLSALTDATRALRRIKARAEAKDLAEEWERVELVQRRGPTIEFTGRLLAETDAPGTDGIAHLEVWETEAGAMVAVREWRAEADNDELHALVVEHQDDPLAMRLAVMDFFRWHQAARSMAHKRLKWNLRLEVE